MVDDPELFDDLELLEAPTLLDEPDFEVEDLVTLCSDPLPDDCLEEPLDCLIVGLLLEDFGDLDEELPLDFFR